MQFVSIVLINCIIRELLTIENEYNEKSGLQNCEESSVQWNKNLKFVCGVVHLKVFDGRNLIMRPLTWDNLNWKLNGRNLCCGMLSDELDWS